jgi:hypothetical protein
MKSGFRNAVKAAPEEKAAPRGTAFHRILCKLSQSLATRAGIIAARR